MSKGTLLDALTSVGLMLLGLFIVWEGLDMGFTSQGAPGAGFFPLIMGVGIAALSAVNAIRAFRVRKMEFDLETGELFKVSICVISLILFIVLSEYIGMVASVFIMTFIVGLVYEGLSVRKLIISAIIAFVVTISNYIVFAAVLHVPLI